MTASEFDHIFVSHTSDDHGPIELHVASAGDPNDPLIVCIHGWPETWWSWRHQMRHLAARGFRVAAMDVRGYGGSSKPDEIAAYRITELASDAAAVIGSLSPNSPAIVMGHDWGAPIAWHTARLYPDLVRAVVGMSVPYTPASQGNPMDLWDLLYPDRFFYMKYFQEPGVAEAAFEADLAAAIRKTYYAAGGESSNELWLAERPADHAFLDGLVDPDPAPAWMAPAELLPTIDALAAGGMRGPFNRYRAQGLDGEELYRLGEPTIAQPACFIAGANDIVRNFVPGMDMFDVAPAGCADFRGSTIVDGAGHWVQQETPEAVNAALDAFLAGL